MIFLSASGHDHLEIVSQPFGRFYIRADLGPCTTGKKIIQKVSEYTGIPSFLINLYTRLASQIDFGKLCQHNFKRKVIQIAYEHIPA